MNEERLGSVATFAQELATHLGAVADGDGDELPTEDELARLVELAFFASLHEEEARRTELTLAWAAGVRHCAAAVALRSPVIATPKSIAKLAPAVRESATSLAARLDGDHVVVWALLEHATPSEQPLIIRSLAPGVLRVDWRGAPRALYARGETLFLGGAQRVISPAERLTAAFTPWAESVAGTPWIDPRAATVTHIAARALAHHHGGMILIVPAGAEPRGLRMHYEATHGADMLASRYAELTDGLPPGERLARVAGTVPPGATELARARQARFSAAIDFVARFTATDNALLIDTDLRVRGFGAQVVESDASLQPFRHVNPYTEDAHVDDITTFKGTRHPAGVIFCLRQDGEAAAIIASQDSRLSLVVKDALGSAEVIGSYERGFGWR